MLFFAAGRILDVPSAQDEPEGAFPSPVRQRPRSDERLLDQPAVATMIVVAVLAGTANIVLQTLAPQYVSAVLEVDPVNSVYVFAPSAIGLAVALFAAPWLIKEIGERFTALVGFVCISASLCLLGLVDHGIASRSILSTLSACSRTSGST